ncbi:unnamed protein product [Rotaria sp. Silwood2]|nr:unnamed protein product [Rotaria sp. Silwood2]CAF4333814.1 unnamed protein product [Rotaria sp. Silwood2]
MSLSMFNNLCQNVLKLIGNRLVSLRVILNNAIDGWSIVSSSLKYHQTTLLQRLHLIDIEPHEFDNLLCNPLIKQVHTLLVDVTPSNPFNYLEIEGVYLAKVCSQLPRLINCRLPSNACYKNSYKLDKYSAVPMMNLPNLLNTTRLRRLTIGMHTSRFLERLISCIPFIGNLSVGVKDLLMNGNNSFNVNTIPATVNTHLVYLSRLHIDCTNSISFHRTIVLLSFVFGQLNHLSVKLVAIVEISSPLVISGDVIQQSCIDRLKPLATYNLNLELDVSNDLEEKIILNSFCNVPFTNRQRPRVFIQERGNYYSGHHYHCFTVFTSPCNDTILPIYLFCRGLEKSCQMPINAIDMFPRANELFLTGYRKETCISELGNFRSSISSLVPWPLLTKISIDEGDIVTTTELESILRMAYNVHTLDIWEDNGIFSHAILHNLDNLGTRVNQQIKTLVMDDISLTFKNAEQFCKLLSNQLSNLKVVFFNIYGSYDGWYWKSSRTVDAEHESTKCILNLIHFLVDHLQQLVSLYIRFIDFDCYETPCIPDIIQQQLHQYLLNRPYRLRCSTKSIEIWL